MRELLASSLVLLLLTVGAQPASACACCAEPGERLELSGPIETYDAGVIDEIAFAPDAALYSTAADWEEQVKGIDNPAQGYEYTLKLRKDGKVWRFDFADAAGHAGELALQLPAKLHKLHVDTAPEPPDPARATSVALYKEWRLDGPTKGSGMFRLGAKGWAHATLILHGIGNGCTDATQFTHWTLDVKGKDVQFRFFGKLASGAR